MSKKAEPLTIVSDQAAPSTGAPQYIDIELIDVVYNARTVFDEEFISSLAATLKVPSDIHTALILKPKDGGRYSLVAGEQRLRSAKLAGLKQVPFTLRDCSRFEAMRVGFKENVDRQNLHAMDEANAYHDLLTDPESTYPKPKIDGALYGSEGIEALCEDLKKKPSIVYQTLKLRELSPESQEAFKTGVIPSKAHAFRIMRLSHENQAKCVKWLEGNPGMSVLGLGDLIKGLTPELAKAPFDLTDTTLTAEAPSCEECRFRTGADENMFPDVIQDTDRCLNDQCFAAKVAAFVDRQAAAAEKLFGLTPLKVVGNYNATDDGALPKDKYKKVDKDTPGAVPAIVTKQGHALEASTGEVIWITTEQPRDEAQIAVLEQARDERQRKENEEKRYKASLEAAIGANDNDDQHDSASLFGILAMAVAKTAIVRKPNEACEVLGFAKGSFSGRTFADVREVIDIPGLTGTKLVRLAGLCLRNFDTIQDLEETASILEIKHTYEPEQTGLEIEEVHTSVEAKSSREMEDRAIEIIKDRLKSYQTVADVTAGQAGMYLDEYIFQVGSGAAHGDRQPGRGKVLVLFPDTRRFVFDIKKFAKAHGLCEYAPAKEESKSEALNRDEWPALTFETHPGSERLNRLFSGGPKQASVSTYAFKVLNERIKITEPWHLFKFGDDQYIAYGEEDSRGLHFWKVTTPEAWKPRETITELGDDITGLVINDGAHVVMGFADRVLIKCDQEAQEVAS